MNDNILSSFDIVITPQTLLRTFCQHCPGDIDQEFGYVDDTFFEYFCKLLNFYYDYEKNVSHGSDTSEVELHSRFCCSPNIIKKLTSKENLVENEIEEVMKKLTTSWMVIETTKLEITIVTMPPIPEGGASVELCPFLKNKTGFIQIITIMIFQLLHSRHSSFRHFGNINVSRSS